MGAREYKELTGVFARAQRAGLKLSRVGVRADLVDGVYHGGWSCTKEKGRSVGVSLERALTRMCPKCCEQLRLVGNTQMHLHAYSQHVRMVAELFEAGERALGGVEGALRMEAAMRRMDASSSYYGGSHLKRLFSGKESALWVARVEASINRRIAQGCEDGLLQACADVVLPKLEDPAFKTAFNALEECAALQRAAMVADGRWALVVARNASNIPPLASLLLKKYKARDLLHMPLVACTALERLSRASVADKAVLRRQATPELLEAVAALYDQGDGAYTKLSVAVRAARALG